jgi:hypothetical protein
MIHRPREIPDHHFIGIHRLELPLRFASFNFHLQNSGSLKIRQWPLNMQRALGPHQRKFLLNLSSRTPASANASRNWSASRNLSANGFSAVSPSFS